jgi:tRNA A-37 threonylcarbamoyl transferase component Bud32
VTEPDPLIHKAAEAVADGVPIDWDRAASRVGSPPQRAFLENLREVRSFAAPLRHTTKAGEVSAGTTPSTFVGLILAIATLQVAIALFGYIERPPDGSEVPASWQLFLLGIFSIAGLALIAGGRHDQRAVLLGTFYLVAGTSFAQRFIGRVAASPRPVWASVYLEAFAPYLLWRFVQAFPRVERFSRVDRLASIVVPVSLMVGSALLLANLAMPIAPHSGPKALLEAFARGRQSSNFYWAAISVLTLTALVVAPFRARSAPMTEKRRVALFLSGIGFGLTPLLTDILVEVYLPSIAARVSPTMLAAATYPFLATIPVTTAYAVMVERVVEVSFVIRRTLQYALAKAAILGLTIVPVALLVQLGLAYRDRTVAQLLELPAGRLLAGLAMTGVVLMLARDRLLDGIDRAFRRGAAPPERAIARVTGEIRDAATLRELSARLEPMLRELFGSSRSAILTRIHPSTAFESVQQDWTALASDSALVALVGDEDDAIDLGHDRTGGLFDVIPAGDRDWLEAHSCAVIVPLRGRNGDLLGILALRTKHGGLRFTGADLEVLRGIAGPIALVLDQILEKRRQRLESSSGDGAAAECARCGAILPDTSPACECGGQLRAAAVPCLIAGKFRVERRLGAGAMGTAYVAYDLALQRTVVVKALPRRVAGATRRLENEARAMARVSDSRLASIYGLEHWRGAPLVVMEYLAGGTLADRLAGRRLAVTEVLAMGRALASGLRVLHDAGLLHRDVKPTNIAFTADGAPKLLDFGLASLIDDAEGPSLAGTPLYLAPELLGGTPASPASDLWSLAIVLFEAIAGGNPVASGTVNRTLRSVAAADIPDLHTIVPDVPQPVNDLFRVLLARDPSQRPQSAVEMVERLDGVLNSLIKNPTFT